MIEMMVSVLESERARVDDVESELIRVRARIDEFECENMMMMMLCDVLLLKLVLVESELSDLKVLVV